MMLEKKTTEFLEVLSSKEPVPGGGGASAAVGAFAAALGMMVASLTEGKKTYAAVEEEILCAKDRLKEIRDRLVHLADEDARAFEPLSKAYGLPRTTEEEQKVREKVMEEALKRPALCRLPLWKRCWSPWPNWRFWKKGKQTGCQRCGVGILFAQAALEGASLNVLINTKMMKDRETAGHYEQRAAELIREGRQRKDRIYERVLKKLQ